MIRKRPQRRIRSHEIDPDEIFIDSGNLPKFDVHQFEGRLEMSISRRTIFVLSAFFVLAGLALAVQTWSLQIRDGEAYYAQSENNHLKTTPIFPNRGLVYDRNGVELIWNESKKQDEEGDFLLRRYIDRSGLAHVLGYVSYPKKDKSGVYYQEELVGKDGLELFYNTSMGGSTGLKITETDAFSNVLSEAVVRPQVDGETLKLSIDSRVQSAMYSFLAGLARQVGFVGGGGVIMDVSNGEILSMTSFPEYDPQLLTDGGNPDLIRSYIESDAKPFLNRVVSGLYTPGSIIKLFVAIGALSEKVITPEKKIYSSGSISIPNPYDPKLKSVFNDWKAHGWVDMRDALAVSSNVYFFEVGGGFEDQDGIGISGIEKYSRLFGIGEITEADIPAESKGTIPNPEWKEANFPGDPWRVGDTYNTAIGQYGFQVTPIQMVRAVAAIANDGTLVTPHLVIVDGESPTSKVRVSKKHLEVIREGMRFSVLKGTGSGLNIPQVKIAAKTGTAELGVSKKNVNSWVTGFFPADNPRYAFAVVMEKGPATNTIGSLFVMRQLFEWMSVNTPEYLRPAIN